MRAIRHSFLLWAASIVVVTCTSTHVVQAQTSNAKGKISRNFYRSPYGSGLSVKMLQDYVDHGNTPAGDTGSMDMVNLTGGSTPFIVAAAAGSVIGVSDTLNGCGCNSAYGPCANMVQILHANGEVSTYLHIVQNSATSRGIANGVGVTQGQIIGVEGDVGWTCGGGSNPRSGACVPVVPAGTGNCGPHLHWNVVRQSTGERVNPMTCNIPANIYTDDLTYTSGGCGSPVFCIGRAQQYSDVLWDGFGQFFVYQNADSIIADSFVVRNFASVVFHAANKIRLRPGFKVGANAYFRAEIAPCNITAPSAIASTNAAQIPHADLTRETEGF